MADNYEMTPNRKPGSSFFGGNPQDQLRIALENNDINTFKKLVRAGDVVLEYQYKKPFYKTCLEIAVSELNKLDFVKYLLEQKVDVNRINAIRSYAPLHFAVKGRNVKAVKMLLKDERIDVNLKCKGNTALLMAIKEIVELMENNPEEDLSDYENIIERLLKKGCNPNSYDSDGVTPIHLASEQGLEKVVTMLAEHAKKPIDIDSYKDEEQKTARDYLNEAFPQFVDKFGTEMEEIDTDKLFYYLSKEDEVNFLSGLKYIIETTDKNEQEDVVNANHGTNTLLQLATEKGMSQAVAALLSYGAKPNYPFPGNPNKPIAIACQYGFKNILKMLLDRESKIEAGTDDYLLQTIIKGMRSYHINSKADHKGCLDILLNNPKIKIDVNHPDVKNNTALHYAARNGDQDTVLQLLRHGACISLRNKFHEPPLADINAKTLEMYLDECITTNDERSSDDNYEIHMEYRFLVYPNNSIENELYKPLIKNNCDNNCNNNLTECDSILAPETDALLYMTRNQELRPLLKHPVITSFLYLKWQRISSLFFANITFYSLLWLCLILYIILGYDAVKQQSDSIQVLNIITHIGAIIGLILLTLRELFQFLVSPTRYVQSFENLMEVALIFVTAAIVCNNSAEADTKQQLSAIAILLSSAELVLLIGQFPTLSTNIVMLKTVSWNFLKFLLWYCILIIAFALSFYTLFREKESKDVNVSNANNTTKEDEDEDFFENPGRSLFKTIVMLTGEFDAGSIKFSSLPVTSHLIFTVFVFMIPIVLFNLLNGLAVSDTQEIRANAELVGHISRVKLISYFESVLIGTLKSQSRPSKCWSWLPSYMRNFNVIKPKMLCIKPFAKRISLFPNFLPQYKIIVKPNQDNKIEIPHSDKVIKFGEDEDVEVGGLCCYDRCQNYRLNPSIVKRAKGVIIKKTTVTEFDEIKDKLTKYEMKLDNLESLLKKLLTTETNR